MAKKLNIFQDEWCDILFEDRNHSYGAFTLRKKTSKHHLFAILITVSLFTLGVSMPSIIKSVLPKTREVNVEVTTLSDLKAPKKVAEQAKDVFVKKVEPIKAAIKFVPPQIKPDEEVKEVDTIRTQEDLNLSKKMISTVNVEGVVDDPNAVDATEVNQIIEEPKEEPPFTYVEQMPEFPEGDILSYIVKKIRYPDVAAENGISGKVYVQFVVGKSGEITDVTVLRGVDPSLDQEAVRVIKSLPRWKPGKQNGNPVRVLMSIPVNFRLE